MPKLLLINSNDFFKQLIDLVSNAKEKVLIQAMVIEFSYEMNDLIDALKKAVQRGVKVQFHIDYYSQMHTLDHINYMPFLSLSRKQYVEGFKKINKSLLQEMKNAGIEFVYTNTPKNILGRMFPVFGRNHTKITIVDQVAFIGGMNFSIEYTERADFMMQTNDQEFVKVLQEQFHRVNEQVPQNDYSIILDEHTKLLVDVGKSGKSIIYNTALQVLNKAQTQLQFISQLLPDFEMLTAINTLVAHGCKVSILTSSIIPQHKKKGVHKTITKRIEYFLYALRAKGITPRYYNGSNGSVHAKLLIVDAQTDHQIAIFGSHNYSKFGVLFGTNEIAIETTDPLIVTQLYTWFKDIEQNHSQSKRFL